MKATELLKSQHQEVERLFKRIEKTSEKAERRQLFQELAHNIVAHDAIERKIFYPACEKALGRTDLLGEALVEHGVVEFSLFLADKALGSDDFEHKMTVLQEMIEHHVEEEEEELFPAVTKALGAEALEELGAEMEAEFEEAKADDFRAPLLDNLRQVLDGETKTKPGNGAKKKAPAKKAAKRAAEPKRASRVGAHKARSAAATGR